MGDGVRVLVMGAGAVTAGSVSRAGWTTVDDERDGSGAVGYPGAVFGTSGPEVTQGAERKANTSGDVTSRPGLVRIEAKRVLLVRKARSYLARQRCISWADNHAFSPKCTGALDGRPFQTLLLVS